MDTKVNRNSSIELLRIVLMILIVFWHFIVHGRYAVIDNGWNLSCSDAIIASLIAFHVNCFIFISGYYGIKLTLKKFLYLFILVIFYGFVNNITTFSLTKEIQYWDLISNIFQPFNSGYFISDYLLLFIMSPMLNLYDTLDNGAQKSIIILLYFTQSGIITQILGRGFNEIALFIMMYLLGRLMKTKENSFKTVFHPRNLVASLICCAIIGYISGYWGNTFQRRFFSYENPLLIFNAICVFYLFKDRFTFSSHKINKLSSGVLGVYILTDCNKRFSHKTDVYIVHFIDYFGIYSNIILLGLAIIIVYFILRLDVIRMMLSEKILKNFNM